MLTSAAEKDLIYQPSQFDNPDEDHWGWKRLAVFSDAGAEEDFAVPTPGVDPLGEMASIQVEVVGSTSSGVVNEHHIVVSVNGHVAGDFHLTGMESKTWSTTIPVAWLSDGETTVRVAGVRDPGVVYSYVDIDSVEVVYPRVFRAEGNRYRHSCIPHPDL